MGRDMWNPKQMNKKVLNVNDFSNILLTLNLYKCFIETLIYQ